MTAVMPAQRPGKSEQVVGTPRSLLSAVERRFGKITFDLAANSANAVSQVDQYYGPGSAYGEDALSRPWRCMAGLLWLNPPYGDIGRWAEKCALERAMGARIALLVPASVGSEWYAKHVMGHAYVFALRPRVTFVGHSSPYPKDLLLCMYEPAWFIGFEGWRWDRIGDARQTAPVAPGTTIDGAVVP